MDKFTRLITMPKISGGALFSDFDLIIFLWPIDLVHNFFKFSKDFGKWKINKISENDEAKECPVWSNKSLNLTKHLLKEEF